MNRLKALLYLIAMFLFFTSCQGDEPDHQLHTEMTGIADQERALWEANGQIFAFMTIIQNIYNGSKSRIAPPAGLQLTADLEYVSKLTTIEAQKIANLGSWIANMDGMVGVENSQIKNFGERISNQGKAIANRGKEIENIDKLLDAGLKSMYGVAYGNYVKSYNTYAAAVRRISRQKRKLRSQLMRSYLAMDKYYRQTNQCMARYRNTLLKDQYLRAGNERLENTLGLSRISDLFTFASAKRSGPECIDRVLLDWGKDHDTNFMHNLVFEVDNIKGKKLKRSCGNSAVAPSPDLADPDSFRNIAARTGTYPGLELSPDFLPTAFFEPFTFYQLYKLLDRNNISIRLGTPPNDDVPQSNKIECRQENPIYRNYKDAAKMLEIDKLASWDADRLEDEPPFAMGQPEESIVTDLRKYRENKSYQKLMTGMDSVFKRIKGCMSANEALVAIADGTEALQAPIVADAITESYMANFHDPLFPAQSKALNMCWRSAEEYRHQAAANNHVINSVLKTFMEVGQEDVPNSPHPVFSTYNATPNVQAGNK